MGSAVYRSKGFTVPKSKDYFVPIPRTFSSENKKPSSYSRRSQSISHSRASAS